MQRDPSAFVRRWCAGPIWGSGGTGPEKRGRTSSAQPASDQVVLRVILLVLVRHGELRGAALGDEGGPGHAARLR
jgi:hypothetical protein